MTTTEAAKPRWVECADKASEVLDKARDAQSADGTKDAVVREADAWVRLGYLYADRTPSEPDAK